MWDFKRFLNEGKRETLANGSWGLILGLWVRDFRQVIWKTSDWGQVQSRVRGQTQRKVEECITQGSSEKWTNRVCVCECLYTYVCVLIYRFILKHWLVLLKRLASPKFAGWTSRLEIQESWWLSPKTDCWHNSHKELLLCSSNPGSLTTREVNWGL